MPEIATHLKTLKLDAMPSRKELKAAYWREIKKWHPDRHNDSSKYAEATRRSRAINAAFECLSNALDGKQHCRTSHCRTKNSNATRQSAHSTGQRQNQNPYQNPSSTGFPDPSVFEVFVKSSHIDSIGYSRAKRTLYIKFDQNAIYSYFDVPEAIFWKFLAAESHGKFAHRHIYGKYAYNHH